MSKSSPLLVKYLKAFEEDPQSKVFAPLAEEFRRSGQVEEAMRVLQKGLKIHPDYILAHLCLASCYCDRERFDLAYQVLAPRVHDYHDNIKLQQIFAFICESLGRHDEALETYRFLSYLSPKDKELKAKITQLESLVKESTGKDRASEGEDKQDSLRPSEITQDWSSLNFSSASNRPENRKSEERKSSSTSHRQSSEDKFDEISMIDFSNFSSGDEEEKKNGKKIDLELPVSEEISKSIHQKKEVQDSLESSAMANHTIAELYIGQGLYRRAIEVLEKFSTLNPKDLRAKERIQEIKSMMKAQRREEETQDLFDALEAQELGHDLVVSEEDEDQSSSLLVIDDEEGNQETSKTETSGSLPENKTPHQDNPPSSLKSKDESLSSKEGHHELMDYFDEKLGDHEKGTPLSKDQETGESEERDGSREEIDRVQQTYKNFLKTLHSKAQKSKASENSN